LGGDTGETLLPTAWLTGNLKQNTIRRSTREEKKKKKNRRKKMQVHKKRKGKGVKARTDGGVGEPRGFPVVA